MQSACQEHCRIHRRSKDTPRLDPRGLGVDDGGNEGDDDVDNGDLTMLDIFTVAMMVGGAGADDHGVMMVASVALVVMMAKDYDDDRQWAKSADHPAWLRSRQTFA